MRNLLALPFVSALALACASAPATPASNRSEVPSSLPRSSIAAVLEHREDLALTDDQVLALQARDKQLQQADEPLRARLHHAAESQNNSRPATSQGDAGGSHRGGGGRHRLGGGGSPNTPRGAPPEDTVRLTDKIDENDTEAYLEVEPLLTEKQRASAREIASRYREALWDERHGHSPKQNPLPHEATGG